MAMKPCDGRQRVVIEDVTPQIDWGSHPVRRVCGEEVEVSAAIFADGHSDVAARVLYRHESESGWRFAPMQALENDSWKGVFPSTDLAHGDTRCRDGSTTSQPGPAT